LLSVGVNLDLVRDLTAGESAPYVEIYRVRMGRGQAGYDSSVAVSLDRASPRPGGSWRRAAAEGGQGGIPRCQVAACPFELPDGRHRQPGGGGQCGLRQATPLGPNPTLILLANSARGVSRPGFAFPTYSCFSRFRPNGPRWEFANSINTRATKGKVASPNLSKWVSGTGEDRRFGHQGFRLCVCRYEITPDSRSLLAPSP
jgi:hypothetical protein